MGSRLTGVLHNYSNNLKPSPKFFPSKNSTNLTTFNIYLEGGYRYVPTNKTQYLGREK
jgi:hypothetical protein